MTKSLLLSPSVDEAPPASRTGEHASHTARAMLGLREMLLNGAFTRGERISELALVNRLGMSRTPIRLALERLAHVGLLEVGGGGGFAVRGFTIGEVYDAIELRGVLEGTAARLAAERLGNGAELEPLRSCCAQMDGLDRLTLDSFAAYMDFNQAFHAAVLDLAKNAILRRSLEQANSLPFASPSAMVFPTSVLPRSDQTLAIAQEQHRALIEAIARRHGTRAEHIAREHAQIARGVFEEAISDRDVLNCVPGGSLIQMSAR
jgi:GntR family transcriptional regulator, vanillate catabolism transcriptional regulator